MALIEINRAPTARQLRQFAGVWVVFFGVAGAVVLHRHGWPTTWVAVWVAIVLAGLTSLFLPRLAGLLYVGLSYATFPIGWLVSHVVLTVVYYGVFTPIGLLMRLVGRDPLQRRLDPSSPSYWKPRPESTDTQRYFHQY
jgi:hypothetical protein